MNPANEDAPMPGEDPSTVSLREARRWVAVYSQLNNLEQELFDVLARLIPAMPAEARKEAEQTNLPVIASQVERFRRRLELWQKRRDELERKGPEA